MPLIQCKECEAEISDKAKSCPKCGAPNDTISSGKLIELLIYLALIAGGAFYLIHRLHQVAAETAPKLTAQEQRQIAYYDQQCRAKGFIPNTPDFSVCIINMRSARVPVPER